MRADESPVDPSFLGPAAWPGCNCLSLGNERVPIDQAPSQHGAAACRGNDCCCSSSGPHLKSSLDFHTYCFLFNKHHVCPVSL